MNEKDNQGSPLELLGVNEGSTDPMMDELLLKQVPGRTFGIKGFTQASEEARKQLEELRGLDTEARLPGESENELPVPSKAADPDPDDDEKPEPQDPSDIKGAEWMAQNEEQVRLRQRQESLERSHQQERRQLQEQLNRMEQQLQQRQQQQQEVQQDPFEYADFSDPAVASAYRQYLENTTEQRIRHAQAPLYHQMAWQNYSSAIERLQQKYGNFKEYFPDENTRAGFTEMMKHYSPEQLAAIPFEQAWEVSYQRNDHARMKTREAELKARIEELEKGSSDVQLNKERAQQKKNLHLVPNASKQGAPQRRLAPTDDEFPKFVDKSPFGALSAKMKKQYAP